MSSRRWWLQKAGCVIWGQLHCLRIGRLAVAKPSLFWETHLMKGLIPRTITLVQEFKERLKLKEFTYKCQISFTEVYNENLILDQDQRAIPLDKKARPGT